MDVINDGRQFTIDVLVVVNQYVYVVLDGERPCQLRSLEDVAREIQRVQFIRGETHVQRWHTNTTFAVDHVRRVRLRRCN